VRYFVTDLFRAPDSWSRAFDLVVESYTLQVLPPELRRGAIPAIGDFVRPHGTFLVITRGKDPGEGEGNMPWPLLRTELAAFQSCGLTEVSFEDYVDREAPAVRRFRVEYRR